MQQQISYKIIQIINDKHINEKIYKLGNGKIFSFTNQPVGTSYILWLNYPKILFHIYQGMKMCKIYNLQCFYV